MRKIALAIALVAPAFSVWSQEGEVLPASYPVTRYTAEWENSPFTREVVKVVERKIMSSFGNAITLEGLVNDATRGPIAYVKDIAEDKTLVVTNEPTKGHPYTIVSADLVNDPRETTITITDGAETAEIGYAENSLTRTIQQFRPPQPANDGDDPREPNRPPNRNRPQKGKKPITPTAGTVSLDPPSNVTSAQANLEAAQRAADAAATTPALDRLDSDSRTRRVPLPKK